MDIIRAMFRYVIAYKPFDVECRHGEPKDVPTLTTWGIPRNLHAAGRLDLDSEGLLLLSNDGELLHRVTHPNFNHSKTYLVLVRGHPTAEDIVHFREGIAIKTGLTRPSDVEILHSPPPLPAFDQPQPAPEKTTWLRIVLFEGKKRQIKRMTAALGYTTVRLVRVAIGPLTLPADLPPGGWRDLDVAERKVLLDWVWPHGRRPKTPACPTDKPVARPDRRKLKLHR